MEKYLPHFEMIHSLILPCCSLLSYYIVTLFYMLIPSYSINYIYVEVCSSLNISLVLVNL